MRRNPFLLITLLFSGFLLKGVHGQTTQPDTAFYALQVKNAIAAYNRFTDGNAPLYNGGAYLRYNLPAKGDPFFASDQWRSGDVFYEDMLYRDIPLRYDIVSDQLIVLSPGNGAPIVLHNEKVTYFNLTGHTFVYLRKDSPEEGDMPPGYYDVLHGEPVRVLVKRSKYLHETVSVSGIERSFLSKDRFYLQKGDRYYPVRTKRSVLEVLGDQKKAVRKYLRKNKIRFYKNPEDAIIRMVACYDQLKH